MTKPTYSLVIQGPIVSRGITGRSEKGRAEGKPLEVVTHHCKPTIRKTIERYGHLFDQIVVATWEGEDIEAEDLAYCPSCQLLKLPPTQYFFKSDRRPTGEVNMLKQYVSTQEGIKALEIKAKPHYVVKVRTDQVVQLEALIKEHQQWSVADRKKRVFVPDHGLTGERIGDFYFVAERQVLFQFCESIVTLLPQYPQMDIGKNSVHIVGVLLYYMQQQNKQKEGAEMIFLKSFQQSLTQHGQTFLNTEQAGGYLKFMADYFACFSQQLLEQTEWRGQLCQVESLGTCFEVAWDPELGIGPPLDAFNIFLYYSPKRYFQKGGPVHLMAILGLWNWVCMRLLPFYRNWIINRTQAS